MKHFTKSHYLTITILGWLLISFFPVLSDGSGPEGALQSNPEDANIRIEITHPSQQGWPTSYQTVFLEGRIEANHGIRRITLNGTDILDIHQLESMAQAGWNDQSQSTEKKKEEFKKLMQQLRDKLSSYHTYYLNRICPLNEGFNPLEIIVEDNLGHQAAKQISIQTVSLDPDFNPRYRMVLAVVPFAEKTGDISKIQDYIYNKLMEALTKQSRFNLVERDKLPWVLIEKAIQTREISQEDVAKQIGNMTPAEGVIFLEIQKTQEGVEILSRYVDVLTGAILLTPRGFSPIRSFETNKAFEEMNIIVSGLAMKFRDAFPLCKGNIIGKKGWTIQVDMGSERGVFPGMVYNIFNKSREPISRAVIKTVTDRSSTARILETQKSWGIKVGDRVMTR